MIIFVIVAVTNALALGVTYIHVRSWRDPSFQRKFAEDNQNPVFSREFNRKFNRSLLFLAISGCAFAIFVDVVTLVGRPTSYALAWIYDRISETSLIVGIAGVGVQLAVAVLGHPRWAIPPHLRNTEKL
jgi:hypothetical protein